MDDRPAPSPEHGPQDEPSAGETPLPSRSPLRMGPPDPDPDDVDGADGADGPVEHREPGAHADGVDDARPDDHDTVGPGTGDDSTSGDHPTLAGHPFPDDGPGRVDAPPPGTPTDGPAPGAGPGPDRPWGTPSGPWGASDPPTDRWAAPRASWWRSRRVRIGAGATLAGLVLLGGGFGAGVATAGSSTPPAAAATSTAAPGAKAARNPGARKHPAHPRTTTGAPAPAAPGAPTP